eukprot:937401-Alexandrium_andersonii.AAC.1
MSASLVGSEMCIRDRLGVQSTLPTDRAELSFYASSLAPRGMALRASPVSYTHLTLPTICSV